MIAYKIEHIFITIYRKAECFRNVVFKKNLWKKKMRLTQIHDEKQTGH